MKVGVFFAAAMIAGLGACAAPAVTPEAATISDRPLDSLPSGAALPVVRADLLATAADRFGAARLTQARSADTYLVVKRFIGMAPPPLPGQPLTMPTPAAALLVKRTDGWSVATSSGWRPASAEAVTDLDRIIAGAAFWSEPPFTPPCPDFGASLLALKVPGKPETVRNSTCMSEASRVVEAALRA
ncbi:MAG TPA: hypothetical protein VD768_01525 [Sphingomicrobium sp.]|nr:hypothetical protein [Sphingomicrobium sp.]